MKQESERRPAAVSPEVESAVMEQVIDTMVRERVARALADGVRTLEDYYAWDREQILQMLGKQARRRRRRRKQ